MTSEPMQLSLGAEPFAPAILTPRLALIAITPKMLRADFARSPEFSEMLEAKVPTSWPPEDWDNDAYQYLLDKMEKHPKAQGWSRYIAIRSPKGLTLAGGCGATGPVEQTDDPEIGYGLLPEFQRQGYATEAVAALVAWIFHSPHVRSVSAQTFPHMDASLRVMAKNGLVFAGPGHEDGTVLYRRYRDPGSHL